MQLLHRSPWRARRATATGVRRPERGGDTLRALWDEYTADPYWQALELAETRGRR